MSRGYPAANAATSGSASPAELGMPAEVGHVGRAAREPLTRGAELDPDSDVPEPSVEDVRPVTRRVHPAVDDRLRRRQRSGAPRNVLSERPAAADVAGLPDPREQRAVAGFVREEATGDHALCPAARGRAQLPVRVHRREVPPTALSPHTAADLARPRIQR